MAMGYLVLLKKDGTREDIYMSLPHPPDDYIVVDTVRVGMSSKTKFIPNGLDCRGYPIYRET